MVAMLCVGAWLWSTVEPERELFEDDARSLPQPSACDATSYAGYGWRGSSASPYGQMNANRCGATGSGGVMTFAPGE